MTPDDDIAPAEPELSASSVLKDSFQLWARNPGIFLTLGLGFAALRVLAEVDRLWHPSLPRSIPEPWRIVTLMATGFLFAFVCAMCECATIFAAVRIDQSGDLSFQECLGAVRGRLVRFWLVRGLYLLVVLTGLLYFVVPGIYLWVVLSLAHVSTVLEGSDWIRAFKRSFVLTRKVFWPVFRLILFLLAAPTAAGFGLWYVKDFFFPLGLVLDTALTTAWLPYAIIALTVAFRRLDPSADFRPTPRDRRAGCFLGLLVALALCALLVSVLWYLFVSPHGLSPG